MTTNNRPSLSIIECSAEVDVQTAIRVALTLKSIPGLGLEWYVNQWRAGRVG